MRPKESYTKEEYNQLKRELAHMKQMYISARDELKNAKFLNNILHERDRGRGIQEVERLIAEQINKRELNELFIKYPYYKEIKEYVEMGITEVEQIVLFTGKSKSSVYRALHDMGLFPPKKRDFSCLRLKI